MRSLGASETQSTQPLVAAPGPVLNWLTTTPSGTRAKGCIRQPGAKTFIAINQLYFGYITGSYSRMRATPAPAVWFYHGQLLAHARHSRRRSTGGATATTAQRRRRLRLLLPQRLRRQSLQNPLFSIAPRPRGESWSRFLYSHNGDGRRRGAVGSPQPMRPGASTARAPSTGAAASGRSRRRAVAKFRPSPSPLSPPIP